MNARFDNINFFDGQPPQWFSDGTLAQFDLREATGVTGVKLYIRRAEVVQIRVEVITPSVEGCGRISMDNDGVFEAVNRQTRNAVGFAVEEPIRCEVRPLRQRRSPTDGVSDRTRPGD